MIAAGTTLQQRYRIDKQIGQGGMGAVYVATDERFGSTVAIKETLCMDDNFRKAIEREARLLNSLKHSALPRVSDHFLESEGQFLVMEFIQGEDLGHMLESRKQPFDVEQVLMWADQLLDALDYLHNQNIPVIHRDIKPQNLKITAGGQIILLDFGLAKGNPTDAGHHTAAKSIFGYSRNYASLEQIQGTGTDPRSDLYSLAATLYHLMTRTPPEDALTRAMSVLNKKPDPLVPANFIDPKIPAGVAGVLQKALDLNANERPASAAEMRQMLHESEKYSHLVDVSAGPTDNFSASVYSQPTQLMSDKTRAKALLNTDVKTQVGSVNVPAKTSATGRRMPSGDVSNSKPRRGLAAAVGALVVLLVGGAVAAGLYIAKPSLFGVEQSKEKSVSPSQLANANTAEPATSPTVQTLTETIGNANANLETVTAAADPKTADKPVEKSKTGRSAPDPSETEDDGTVNISGDPNDPDQVTITKRDKNGKITSMTVNPKVAPDVPIPPLEDSNEFPRQLNLKTLSPEQRLKLQRVWRFNQLRKNSNVMPPPQP